MRHKMAGRKLSRTSSHRKALFANLAQNLIEHGTIRTTLPKAKDLRRVVEPLITKAKAGNVAARREVAKTIRNEVILKKLFDEVAPTFAKRDGGYTRIVKDGFRQGDAAPMAYIQLVEDEVSSKPAKKAAPKKAAAKTEEAPKAETVEATAEEKTEEAKA